ncbi:MAG: gluconate 2-dehydrogenase subunit 3 family protein [Gammaproteobacteria bacterium]|nr:gluconate 2-dehydrogenase subunit 3 family protein [Gammaproteobacteria bacterium]
MSNHLSRREFLILVSAATAAIPFPALSKQRTASGEAHEKLEDPWLTLAVVQEHLFPAEKKAPGASDIQALSYLRQLLQAPDTDREDVDFVIKGVSWLNDLSSSTYQRLFHQLDTDLKEKILRKIEQSSAGERWLSLQLSYLIEALLADPVYGGNANSQGWQWLEHQPGFPRPTADKRYFKLRTGNHKGFKA